MEEVLGSMGVPELATSSRGSSFEGSIKTYRKKLEAPVELQISPPWELIIAVELLKVEDSHDNL